MTAAVSQMRRLMGAGKGCCGFGKLLWKEAAAFTLSVSVQLLIRGHQSGGADFHPPPRLFDTLIP